MIEQSIETKQKEVVIAECLSSQYRKDEMNSKPERVLKFLKSRMKNYYHVLENKYFIKRKVNLKTKHVSLRWIYTYFCIWRENADKIRQIKGFKDIPFVVKTIRGSVKKIVVVEEKEPVGPNLKSYKESSSGVKLIESSKKILLPKLSKSNSTKQIFNQSEYEEDNSDNEYEEEEEEYSDTEEVVVRKKIKLEFGNLIGKINKDFEENKVSNFICDLKKAENSINEPSKMTLAENIEKEFQKFEPNECLDKPNRKYLEKLTGNENKVSEDKEAPYNAIITTEKVIENGSLENFDNEIDAAEFTVSKPDQEITFNKDNPKENLEKCQQTYNPGNKTNPIIVKSNEDSSIGNKKTSLFHYILNILYILVLVVIFILSVLFGKKKTYKIHNP